MNLSSIEKELLHLQALVARWMEQKYTPDIERDIALQRVRNIYTEFLGINDEKIEKPECEVQASADEEIAPEPEPEPVQEIEPEPAPVQQSIAEEEYSMHYHEDETSLDGQSKEECVDDQLDAHIQDIAQVIDNMAASAFEPQADEQPQAVDDGSTPDEQSVEDEERRGRFIHDLFCNDETFYEGEMRKIAALASFDDVLIYIGQKYAWTPNNATAEEFVQWISTRFID